MIIEKEGYFHIHQIYINHQLASDKLNQFLLENQDSYNIFSLNLEQVQYQIKKRYPQHQFQLIKKYPDELWIKLLPYDFITYIRHPKSKSMFAIDSHGKIIDLRSINPMIKEWMTKNSKQLIPIIYNDEFINRTNLFGSKQKVSATAYILNDLKELQEKNKDLLKKIESIHLFKNEKNNYFLLRSDPTQFFFEAKYFGFQLKRCVYLLSFFENQSFPFKTIDLRFHNVIGQKK